MNGIDDPRDDAPDTVREHDDAPPSIPAVLTDEQAAIVKALLRSYCEGKTPREYAKALSYARMYVRGVLDGEVRPSVHFATQLARVLDVDLLVMIEGGVEP